MTLFIDCKSPYWMRKFRAVDVMSRPVISFHKIERVKHVLKVKIGWNASA